MSKEELGALGVTLQMSVMFGTMTEAEALQVLHEAAKSCEEIQSCQTTT